MMNSTAKNIGLEKKVKKYYDRNTSIFIKVRDVLQLALLTQLINYRFLVFTKQPKQND